MSAAEHLTSGSSLLVTSVLSINSAVQLGGTSALVQSVAHMWLSSPITPGGSMTTNTSGLSSSRVNNVFGVAADVGGGIYVVERNNHRLVYFPSGSFTATRVYGQLGNFTFGTANRNLSSPDADSLSYPSSVRIDAASNIYVADRSNHRSAENTHTHRRRRRWKQKKSNAAQL